MPSTNLTEALSEAERVRLSRCVGRTLVGLSLVGAVLLGCERDKPAAPPAPVDATSPAVSASAARPHLEELPPGPWTRAAGGDELAKLRLATDLSAMDLLEVAASDSPRWGLALAALAEADDAELAFAGLAALAERDGERRGAALETLRAIATRRPRPTEPWDPPGLAEGAAILNRISRDASLPRAERAVAISALRGLARAGHYDAAAIARSLDPEGARAE